MVILLLLLLCTSKYIEERRFRITEQEKKLEEKMKSNIAKYV